MGRARPGILPGMARIPGLLAAAAALTVLFVGGCAGDTGDGADAKPAVCESFAAAQLTADHIRDANVSENGLSQVRPLLTQLREQLTQLVADAKAQYATQADAIRTAVDGLTTSVETALAAPSATNLTAVRDSVGQLRESVDGLRDAISGTC
ncbi:hypothetical protein SAMN05443668_111151 [Cryptosporangium aurantiacum]|uniref:Lipoprotein n=2 Tax=Cryptosporangium aurantiacum TaxID=134849 RepID=A0A1M7RFR4_9ACTN|nr:hypothetical protein SAMN05443668_111151 [Cryptosporangium aurantiacum]